jgi:hypothetical protein
VSECAHPEIVPCEDNPNFARCTSCGDDTFPLTYETIHELLDSVAVGIDRVVAERNRLKLQLDKALLGLRLIVAQAGTSSASAQQLGIYAESTLEEVEAVP